METCPKFLVDVIKPQEPVAKSNVAYIYINPIRAPGDYKRKAAHKGGDM